MDNITDLAPYTRNQQIIEASQYTSDRGASIPAIIGGWLDSIMLAGSQSQKTLAVYKNAILQFRSLLQSQGLDLLFDDPQFGPMIADYAQVFARTRSAQSYRPGATSRATQLQRLSALSSFYSYVLQRGHIPQWIGNPIQLVKRPKRGKAFAKAKAIKKEVLQKRLASIKPEDLRGLRDLALLSVLLSTGRRVSEITGMRRKDIEEGQQLAITFYGKGGKVLYNSLSPEISDIVRNWLWVFYNGQFFHMSEDTPVWVKLTPQNWGEPLEYKGVAGVCKKYLGTTKVHTTRHSYTLMMIQAGISAFDLMKQLGHSNLATTTEYTEALAQQDTNGVYANKVTEMLGFKKSTTRKNTTRKNTTRTTSSGGMFSGRKRAG